METKHWTQEQLLAVLYGARSEEDAGKDAHFSRCAECARRLRELGLRRDAILAPVTLPEKMVVAQRQSIMRRVAATRNSKSSLAFTWWRPLAALAAVALLLMAIVLRVPSSRKDSRAISTAGASSLPSAGDAKFFNEVMYEASRTESAALTPLHNLFQTETQTRAVRR